MTATVTPKPTATDLELLELIGKVRWRKTTSLRMRNCPHEYINAEDGPDQLACRSAMVAVILERGYIRSWGKGRSRRPYRYYHVGGFKYWFIDEPGWILNRESLP